VGHRTELMYVTTGITLITATNLENKQQESCIKLIFVLMQRDSKREFGILARSVRVKLLLNCYTVPVLQM